MEASPSNLLLKVQDLSVTFDSAQGPLCAVDSISFSIDKGKVLGIVGESGCGKSVTALSIMRLLRPPGKSHGGPIRFAGEDLLSLPESTMRTLRGNRISMIFQEPMTALNPVFTTGAQVAEVVRKHKGKSRKEAMAAAVSLFRRVGIPSPHTRVHNFPHQMSGGMRQRVMIAMALACEPDLLIADEPTTALDVTIQAQILALLRELQQSASMGILLITHDLGVVAETCDNVLVMYAGRIVESAPVVDLFQTPYHPYTAGLLASIPRPESHGTRLREIPGMVPPLHDLPTGCKFQDRCFKASDTCREREPELVSIQGSAVRCHHPLSASDSQPEATAP